MTELQRHIEANEKEEVRHAEAGECEMATHADNTRSLPELRAEVQAADTKARRATILRDIIFGLCIVGALVLSLYTIVTRNNESRKNGQRIDALTVELDEARTLLVERSEDDKAILECQSRFDTVLRQTSFEPLASIGDLVVIISTIVPGPEREAAVADSITALGKRVDETRVAIALLAEWNNGDMKLPCPI